MMGFSRFLDVFQAPSVPVRRVAQLLGLVSTAATDRFPRPAAVNTVLDELATCHCAGAPLRLGASTQTQVHVIYRYDCHFAHSMTCPWVCQVVVPHAGNTDNTIQKVNISERSVVHQNHTSIPLNKRIGLISRQKRQEHITNSHANKSKCCNKNMKTCVSTYFVSHTTHFSPPRQVAILHHLRDLESVARDVLSRSSHE